MDLSTVAGSDPSGASCRVSCFVLQAEWPGASGAVMGKPGALPRPDHVLPAGKGRTDTRCIFKIFFICCKHCTYKLKEKIKP